MSKLSIIIPVYYEADSLMECYNDLKSQALKKLDEYELIFVDDGSGDSTYEICKDIAKEDKNVRVIKLSRNFGSHSACFAGIEACTGDCCTIKAADLQEPSTLILDLYDSWKQGNKVVLAVRDGRDDGFFQSLFGNMYYGLMRKFVNKRMPKTGFDCFLLDRKAIEALKLLDENNTSIVLQILWIGFQTSIVKYKRLARRKGKSKWTLAKKIKLILDSFVSFSSIPIRFIKWMGMIFALGSLIWGVILIVFNVLGLIETEGWTSLMLVILFSTGMIMIMLGLLGEYMWRILDASHNRPIYLIEEEFRVK